MFALSTTTHSADETVVQRQSARRGRQRDAGQRDRGTERRRDRIRPPDKRRPRVLYRRCAAPAVCRCSYEGSQRNIAIIIDVLPAPLSGRLLQPDKPYSYAGV